MSILRVTVVRLKETPKYLLGQGDDEEVIKTLYWMANTYNRPCSLTLEQLQACGKVTTAKEGGSAWHAFTKHIRGLFVTRKMAFSTSLIWFSWTLIGLAYPLYIVFLRKSFLALPRPHYIQY